MADNVKVFTHIDAQTIEGDITIVETTGSTQAVVKDVTFKGKSTHYPTEMTLKLNDKLLGETYTSDSGEELNVGLSGNLIMDATSTLKVSIPPITQVAYVAKLDAIVFSDGENSKMKDTNIFPILSTTAYTNTDVEANLAASGLTSINNGSHSAFAVIRNFEVQYFRFYDNELYRHTDGNASVETAITVPQVSHSMCTDGTYFYEKSAPSTNEIRVYNVSDYVQQTSITTVDETGTNVPYTGQSGNQGSFMLTHDGYIYTKYNGPATTIYKTEISTGTTTTITVTSVGTYSGGAVITRGLDTVFYLVEKGDDAWYKVNLSDESVSHHPDGGGMTHSTEYGNAAFEISGGYVGVIDGINLVVINVVAGSYVLTSSNGYTNGGYFSVSSGGFGTYCSVAALSISANIINKPKDLNYSIYASGVEIT
jgi:hypothetical protein